MSLVAIAAAKGSPGVTTTAVALGAVWPRPALVAECDPAGGDLATRLRPVTGAGFSPARNLLSYAAAARRGAAPVLDHAQEADGGLPVLLGLQSAEQAAGLGGLWSSVADGLGRVRDTDVLADCGRYGPGDATIDLLRAADLVLLLTRPTVGAALHLRSRLTGLLPMLDSAAGRVPDVGVLVVAPLRHTTAAAEVAAVLEQADLAVPVLGRLADDPDGAAGLRGEPVKRLDRSWLVRSAREVALVLDARLTERQSA